MVCLCSFKSACSRLQGNPIPRWFITRRRSHSSNNNNSKDDHKVIVLCEPTGFSKIKWTHSRNQTTTQSPVPSPPFPSSALDFRRLMDIADKRYKFHYNLNIQNHKIHSPVLLHNVDKIKIIINLKTTAWFLCLVCRLLPEKRERKQLISLGQSNNIAIFNQNVQFSVHNNPP